MAKRKSSELSMQRMDKDASFFKNEIHPYIDGDENIPKYVYKFFPMYLQKITNIDQSNIKIIRKLGHGISGSVYIAQIGERILIIKIGIIHDLYALINETKMHLTFYNADMGTPKLIFSYALNWGGSMDYAIGMSLDEYAISFGMWRNVLRKRQKRSTLECMAGMIDSVIERMCKKNLRHGDLHWDNIGFQVLGPQASKRLHTCTIEIDKQTHKVAPLLIDFGYASEGKCIPAIEYTQLIRTLNSKYTDIDKYNQKTLLPILLALLKPHINPNEDLLYVYKSNQKKWTQAKQDDIEKYHYSAVQEYTRDRLGLDEDADLESEGCNIM